MDGLWKWWGSNAPVEQAEHAEVSLPTSRRESTSTASSKLRKGSGLAPCCEVLSLASSDLDSLKRSESRILHPEMPNGNISVEIVLGEGISLGVVLTDDLMIHKVRPHSPAEKAGLDSYIGYHFQSINGYDVHFINQVTSALHTDGPVYRLVIRPGRCSAGGGDHCKRSATSAGGGDPLIIYHHSSPSTPVEYVTSCDSPRSNLSGTSPKWRIPAEEYYSPHGAPPAFPILVP
eukprot:TRINITY_DN21960_c0_g1_i1.p1 TRINITY_DN21960_c0_g1~~TRINITY_DN21960_c0_g1_i1.p1  ORF type:complete len:247 (+),score=34.31 TRINITY_DN21960_c0_g1_i1:45-743(+)